jgi:hypothetical protein
MTASIPGGMTITVEVAFGATGPDDPSPTWTDISRSVLVSSGIVAEKGRETLADKIGVGTLKLTLNNQSDDFNPENTGGAYYPDVVDGVPIRLRLTNGATTETVWRGYVDAWPQVDRLKEKTVEVECFDMFGLIAQGIAPVSGWDLAVEGLATQPDRWFKCGDTGWMDNKTAKQWKHTGGLKKREALIYGADGAWGQDDPDGFGQVDELLLQPYAGRLVVSMWIDLDIVAGTSQAIACQGLKTFIIGVDSYPSPQFDGQALTVAFGTLSNSGSVTFRGGAQSLFSLSGLKHVLIVIDPPVTAASWWSPSMNWAYGSAPNAQFAACYINGVEVPGIGSTLASNPTPTAPTSPMLIGGFSSGIAPYVGALDEVLIWQDHPDSFDDLGTIAAELYSAGSSPWSNERLDERLGRLTSALGVPNSVGALDVSGIVTQQSYASADPLDLLQKVEDTEQGRVWIDRLGDIRFSQRSWAWDDTVSNTVQFTFSDDPAEIAGGDFQMLAEGLKLTRDTREVTNVAKVNSTNGRQQVVQDDASIMARGIRNPYTLSGLLHPSDRQSLSIAEWTILSRSQPQTKLTELTVSVSRNSALYATFAQTVEEGHLVEVNREGVQYLCHVTGIKHRVSEGGWFVTLSLDSTRTGYSFFKWGTSTWGGSVGWAF